MRKRIFHSMLLLAVVTILTGAILSGAVAHAVLTERVHAEVRSCLLYTSFPKRS